jgi:chromosome segregation ATPase
MSKVTAESIKHIEELLDLVKKSKEKAAEVSRFVQNLGGEFEQEISTDLEDFEVRLQEIWNELDTVLGEAKTLKSDRDEIRDDIRQPVDDEEQYKMKDEDTQNEIKRKLVEREREIREEISKIADSN